MGLKRKHRNNKKEFVSKSPCFLLFPKTASAGRYSAAGSVQWKGGGEIWDEKLFCEGVFIVHGGAAFCVRGVYKLQGMNSF